MKKKQPITRVARIRVSNIFVSVLVLMVFPLVALFGVVSSVSADTVTGQCRTIDKSRCPADQYDHNHCLDRVSQYYTEIGEASVGDPETDNWTANSCAVTLNGCFVPIPNHNNSRGEQLGVCIAPVEEELTEVVNCDNVRSTSYRDQCPANTYTLCFDTNAHPISATVAAVDCRIDPPGPDELFFFRDQASLNAQQGLATADCSVGQPLSEDYPDICGGDRPISCVTSDRYRCCATQADCDSIAGDVQSCIAIPRVSANLNDCEANTSRPHLCATQSFDGAESYFCCSSEDACADEKDGRITEPLVTGGANQTHGSKFAYCRQVPADQRSDCNTCVAKGAEGEYIFTAVGCVGVSGKALAADIIKLLLGIAGGVALLSFLNAAFKLTISRGDSTKVKEAKELVTAAVTGLLFIIFSVIIMEFVGVRILHIPGLG